MQLSANTPAPSLGEADVFRQIQAFLANPGDPYARMNRLRDWINASFPDYELYLEDVWNERVAGETWFEYILRSRRTLEETDILAYDVYRNHRDAKGVWHLGDYRRTVILLADPEPLMALMRANGPPWTS